jgi:hypothetical protein
LDELSVFEAAAVAADELYPGVGDRDVEHPSVRGVHQIETNDLAGASGQFQVRIAVDEEHVTEPAHRGVRGQGPAERGDGAVGEQDVVQGEDDLPVDRRPVVGVGGLDDNGSVQAHFLAVVLADVRVVPVHAGVGKGDSVAERAAHLDGVLGVVGAVEPVVQPQAVPVHGGLQVPVVGGVHHHLGVLPDVQGGPGMNPL